MPLEKCPAVASDAESIKHQAGGKLWPVVLERMAQPEICTSQAEAWPGTTAHCMQLFLLPSQGGFPKLAPSA